MKRRRFSEFAGSLRRRRDVDFVGAKTLERTTGSRRTTFVPTLRQGGLTRFGERSQDPPVPNGLGTKRSTAKRRIARRVRRLSTTRASAFGLVRTAANGTGFCARRESGVASVVAKSVETFRRPVFCGLLVKIRILAKIGGFFLRGWRRSVVGRGEIGAFGNGGSAVPTGAFR